MLDRAVLNPIAGNTPIAGHSERPEFRSLCFGHGSYWLLSRQSVRQESTYYVVVAFSLSITLRWLYCFAPLLCLWRGIVCWTLVKTMVRWRYTSSTDLDWLNPNLRVPRPSFCLDSCTLPSLYCFQDLVSCWWNRVKWIIPKHARESTGSAKVIRKMVTLPHSFRLSVPF